MSIFYQILYDNIVEYLTSLVIHYCVYYEFFDTDVRKIRQLFLDQMVSKRFSEDY